MASFEYVGYYFGIVGAGNIFHVADTYSNIGPRTVSDGDGGNQFTLGEALNSGAYTFKGYVSSGEIIVGDGPEDIMLVPAGGNWVRTSGSQVAFTAASFTTCFLRGTLILTSRGEVKVEALRAGDMVATRFGGVQPIRWIGTQSFDGRFAGRTTTPIRFARGSLGSGMPSCDLFVSPGHAMLVGEVLVHAGALVDGETIVQQRMRGTIDYFHLDLGPHDCVLANGAWAESYFEDRNRDSFHNAAAFHALHPGHVAERQASCLPIVTAGHPAIEGLRAMLSPRRLRLAA